MILKTRFLRSASLLVVAAMTAFLCGACGSGSGNTPPPGPQSIEFEDVNLEGCVRERIGGPEGPLFPADVKDVPYLECPDRAIALLGGLEHMTGLTHLSLWENRIVDLTPLRGLTSLETLQLGHNEKIGRAHV